MKKKYADMDPLEEIRAIREEINREFKTASALSEYLRTNPAANYFEKPKIEKRSASPRRKKNEKAVEA